MRSDRHSPKTIEQILMSNADAVFQFSRGTSGEQTDLRIRAKSVLIASILDIFTRFGLSLSELNIVDIGCSRCDILLALRELGGKELFGVNFTPFNFQWLRDPAKFDEFWGGSTRKDKVLRMRCRL